MSDSLTDDFVQWVSEQLKEHKHDVQLELGNLEPKKSLAIAFKLKLKAVGNLFVPSYHFSIPRAAVKAEGRPEKQLSLPGV